MSPGAGHRGDPGARTIARGAPEAPPWASERTRAHVHAMGDTLAGLAARDLPMEPLLVAPDNVAVPPALISTRDLDDADKRADALWTVMTTWPGRPSRTLLLAWDTWVTTTFDTGARCEALAISLVLRSPGALVPGSIHLYRSIWPYSREVGGVRWAPELGPPASGAWRQVYPGSPEVARLDLALMAGTVADEEVPYLGALLN